MTGTLFPSTLHAHIPTSEHASTNPPTNPPTLHGCNIIATLRTHFRQVGFAHSRATFKPAWTKTIPGHVGRPRCPECGTNSSLHPHRHPTVAVGPEKFGAHTIITQCAQWEAAAVGHSGVGVWIAIMEGWFQSALPLWPGPVQDE